MFPGLRSAFSRSHFASSSTSSLSRLSKRVSSKTSSSRFSSASLTSSSYRSILPVGAGITLGVVAGLLYQQQQNKKSTNVTSCESSSAASAALLPSPSSSLVLPSSSSSLSSSSSIIEPDAPTWLQQLACNPSFIYRDILRIYDVSNHLIFKSLIGDKRVESFYYFTERLRHELSKHHDDVNNEEYHPEIRAVFKVGNELCGHKGIIHGGFSAAVLDEVCGAAVYSSMGGGNFTANLNVDYIRPVMADRWLLVRAKVVKVEGRKAYVSCMIEDGNGNPMVKAQALFVRPKIPPSALVAAVQ